MRVRRISSTGRVWIPEEDLPRPWVKWVMLAGGFILGYVLGVLHIMYVLATGHFLPW